MRFTIRSLAVVCQLTLFVCGTAIAQNQGGGNGGQPGGGGGGQQSAGGIVIDGEGVVRTSPDKRISPGQLRKLQEEFAESQLSPEIIQQSEARVLSLKQVDNALRQALDAGEPIPDSLMFLAGLQRIDFIRINRADQDILIIGPAEGFAPGANGQMVGMTTGRPPLNLDDLVVALRSTFSGQREMGVSIDPTPENMAKLQRFVQTNSGVTTSGTAQQQIRTMGTILGNQLISLWGVPDDSHFALALVEADLRMKRMAMGHEPTRVRGVLSHLALLRPQGNSLQRWWFMPLYEPIATNAERTLFEIRGQRAQLMAQEEISDAGGERTDAAFTRKTTEKFAALFTEHFEELAANNPSFAELQNLYDLALLSALAQENWPFEDRQSGLETLLSDARLPQNSYAVPQFVRSTSVTKKAGNYMLGLVGGVTINVRRIANDPTEKLETTPGKFDSSNRSDQWWWTPESN